MNLLLSYLTGVIAAFTPCVIVLIPLVLYRFYRREKEHVWLFVQFCIGFLLTFTLLGLVIGSMLTSSVQNGFRLGFGILFIVLGILAFSGRLNPLKIPLVRNTFILGMLFAFMLGANPCTLPYLGIVMAIPDTSLLVMHMIFFAAGLLTPAILFAILGQAVLDFASKRQQVLHRLTKLMSLVLIAAGGYLIFSMTSFGRADVLVDALLLAIVFVILIRAFFLVNTLRDMRKPHNLLLFLALLLILGAALYHCDYFVRQQAMDGEDKLCTSNMIACEACIRCAALFSIAAVIGLGGVYLASLANKQHVQSLHNVQNVNPRKGSARKKMKKVSIAAKGKTTRKKPARKRKKTKGE